MRKMDLKKTIAFLLVCVFFSISMIGCGGSKPEDRAELYFDALNNFDMKKLSELIDSTQLAQFEQVVGTSFKEGSIDYIMSEYIKAKTKDFTATVTDVHSDGSAIVVTVECPYIDWEAAYKKINSTLIDQVFMMLLSSQQVTDADMPKLLQGILLLEEETESEKSETTAIKDFPVKNETFNVTMIQENGDWYVRNVKPRVINSSWLGLKEFSKGISEMVSSMGIESQTP